MRQQLRWHNLIDSEWVELRRMNMPQAEFERLAPSFQLNLDETCFLCSEGNLRVIGEKERRFHDNNMGDSRFSITVLRVGNAAGARGPIIYLAKGATVNRRFMGRKLERLYGLPEGSCVLLMTKNAYMDDETWDKVVEILAPGIRKMEVSSLLFACFVESDSNNPLLLIVVNTTGD